MRVDKEAAIAYGLRCKEDIGFFAREFFPHIVNRKPAEFHEEIFKDLKTAKYYACAAPRGHAKSTLGLVIYPMHYALFRAEGNITLLSASESFVINEIVRVIKNEFENNDKLKACFGGELKTSKWSETYFVLKNGIAFEAGGIGGQLRGGRRGLICLDDLESNESVESEDQREKLRNRINKELIPKLLPEGQIIYFGTLISPLCYLNHIIKMDSGWNKRVYDCYKEGVEAEGHELWPEMLNHAELQRRKSVMGTNAFQAEYRNNPISEATAAIKENMVREWTQLPNQMSVSIAVDPAYSEDPKADYKVCGVIGCDQSGNRYLVSYLRGHMPSGEFIDGILNIYLQYKNICTGLGLPSGGGDKEFWTSFMRRANERKINPPVIELKNTFITAGGTSKTNKKARAIAALQPLFEAGKYYLHASHVEAKEEILNLNPITEQPHDDIVDVMAYAEQIVMPYFFDVEVSNESHKRQVSMAGKSTNYGMDD